MAETENFTVLKEYVEEVDLFKCLSVQETCGTSYDYFLKYPNFFEEIYYLLEHSTLQNSDEERLISVCQDIVYARNSEILRNFGKTSEDEVIELDYGIPIDTNISLEQVRISETQ